MNATPLVRMMTPVDQLPAEGYEAEASETPASPLDFYVAALAESEIGFEVTEDGVKPNRPKVQDVFQSFDVSQDKLNPLDDAVEIDFNHLFSDRGSFDDLNDASEPQDFVRRFLETLGPALDAEPDANVKGRHLPVIRWEEREEGPGARVQLLGILEADDETFDSFCKTEGDASDLKLILEDAEVEAHGWREIAVSLAVLGVSLGGASTAEAGLFSRIFDTTAEAESGLQPLNGKRAMKRAKARVVRSDAGYIDSHNDALIDKKFLEASAGSNAERRIIVDIEKQRAYLLIDGRVAIDTAVSTARGDKFTPRGSFKITERVREGKTSNLYDCPLPYWMRLDHSAIGLHIGDLPGYAASAGCVRLPFSIAPYMFDHTRSGTTVDVVDSWNPKAKSAAPVLIAQAN